MFRVLYIIIFLSLTQNSFANSNHTSDDLNAHSIIAFQATFLVERFFQIHKFSKPTAIIIGSTITLAASYYKESEIDKNISHEDLRYSFYGTTLASLIFIVLPDKKYRLEADTGLFSFKASVKDDTLYPPSTKMIKTNSTIWFFDDFIGLHQFSGGYDHGGDNNEGKRLLYGTGLRFSLYPFFKKRQSGQWFTYWLGADYGLILFATDEQIVAYKKQTETTFYSTGIRIHLGKRLQFNIEGSYIPYDKEHIQSHGINIGISF